MRQLKWICILLPLLLFISVAYSQDITITCDKDVYTCLRDCEAVCNINSSQSQKVNVSAIFDNSGVKPEKIQIWKNVTYNKPVDSYGNVTYYQSCDSIEVVNQTTINCTTGSNSTLVYKNTEQEPKCWNLCYDDYNSTHYWANNWEVVGSYEEEDWRWDWVDLNSEITYSNPKIRAEINLSNVTVKFKFQVPISSYGKFNITAENSENYSSLDPWWNSSWQYRRNITITLSGQPYTRNFEPVEIFVNASSWTYKPYNDSIRIINKPCDDDTGVEIPSAVYNITQTNGVMNSFTVAFEANTTSQNTVYCMYYDTSSKGNPNYPSFIQVNWANYQIANKYLKLDLRGNEVSTYGGWLWINLTQPTTNQTFPTDANYYLGLYSNGVPITSSYWLKTEYSYVKYQNPVFVRVVVYYNTTGTSYLNATIDLWANSKDIILGKEFGIVANTNPTYKYLPYNDVDAPGGTWSAGYWESSTGTISSTYDYTTQKKWIFDWVTFSSPRQNAGLCFVQPDYANTSFISGGRFSSGHDDGFALVASAVNTKVRFIYRVTSSNDYTLCQDAFRRFTNLPTYSIGDIPPSYSLNSTNATIAGSPVLHKLYWQDDFGLSGYIFSFDNCTGNFVNDTWQKMTGTGNWSNVVKTINSTVGCTVRWCVYANDTSNNWNSSCENPFSYETKAPLEWWNYDWHKRVRINITNLDSIDHVFEPLGKGIMLDFETNPTNASKEVRVIQCSPENSVNCTSYTEIPSWVWNITTVDGYDDMANINFEVNVSANSWRIYEIYYDNPSAQYPNYQYQVFSDTFNRGSIGSDYVISNRSENTCAFINSYPICSYYGINNLDFLNVTCIGQQKTSFEWSSLSGGFNFSYPASLHQEIYFNVKQNGIYGPRGGWITRLWNNVTGCSIGNGRQICGFYTEEESGGGGNQRQWLGALSWNGTYKVNYDVFYGVRAPAYTPVPVTNEKVWRDVKMVWNGVDTYSLYYDDILNGTATDANIKGNFTNANMFLFMFFIGSDVNNIVEFRVDNLCIVTSNRTCNSYDTPVSFTAEPEESKEALYYEVSSCQWIESSGEYRLTQNITQGSTSPCISIRTNDVILDGQGYTIKDADDTVYNTIEVISGLNNITIKNFNLENLNTTTAVIEIFYDNNNIKIQNNSIRNFMGAGIQFDQPSGTSDTWVDFGAISRNVVVDNNTVNRKIWNSSEMTTDQFGRWGVVSTAYSGQDGVRLNAVANANFTNNRIINVTGDRALSLDHAYNITINGNVFQGNGYIWSHRNYFDGTDYAYKNIHVFNNTFLNSAYSVAIPERQRGYLIENNTCEQILYGIIITKPSKKDTVIRNNVFKYGFDGGGGIYINQVNPSGNITIDNNTFINTTVWGVLVIRTRYNYVLSDVNFTNNIINSSDYEAKQTNIKYSTTWLTGEIGYQIRVDGETNNTVQNILSCNNTWNVENSSAILPVVYRGVPTYKIHLYNVMHINSSSCQPYISVTAPTSIDFGNVNVGYSYTVDKSMNVDTNLLDTKTTMSSTDFTGTDTIGKGNFTYYANYTSYIDETKLKQPVTLTMYRKNILQTDYYKYKLYIPTVRAGTYTATWYVNYAMNSQPVEDFVYDE